MQTRYYDPYVGRFISPDDVSYLGANGDLLSYNLYAYCSNNPVMYVDPTGEFAISIAVTLGTGFIVAMCGLVYDATHEQYVGKAFTGATDFIWDIIGSFKKSKSEEKTEEAVPPQQYVATYYHVTTPEAAMSIISSGVIYGSEWEGGLVYAWKLKPDRYAIENSGAHQGVIITFKTTAAFSKDNAIRDPRVSIYLPVKANGPVKVWDVKFVR